MQQGDGSVIESPAGKVMLVDGGDNQLFARYLAGRFRGTTEQAPDRSIAFWSPMATRIISSVCRKSSIGNNDEQHKRLFIQPKRVYHNGIVKRPGTKEGKSVPDKDLLGPTEKADRTCFSSGLDDNLLKVADGEMNEPFQKWKKTLKTYNERAKSSFKRLHSATTTRSISLPTKTSRSRSSARSSKRSAGKPALKFLGSPPKGPRIGHESLETDRPQVERPFGFPHHQRPLDVFRLSTAVSAICSPAT